MPKINKSIYKLSSRYRNQLLNQAVRNVNNNILSSADGDDDNDEHNINLESSVFFSDNNEKDELNMHNSNCLQHKQQRNFEYNELSFHRDNINDDCLVTSDLSAILKDNLPKDARTLMKTSLKVISLRNVSPGQYWHNGLTKQLSILYKDTNIMELKLTFNIDGVPISMSSSSTLWESKHQHNENNQNLINDEGAFEEVSSVVNESNDQSETSTEKNTDDTDDLFDKESDKNINFNIQNSSVNE